MKETSYSVNARWDVCPSSGRVTERGCHGTHQFSFCCPVLGGLPFLPNPLGLSMLLRLPHGPSVMSCS